MAININLNDLETIIDRVLSRRLGPGPRPPLTAVPVYDITAERPVFNRLPPPPSRLLLHDAYQQHAWTTSTLPATAHLPRPTPAPVRPGATTQQGPTSHQPTGPIQPLLDIQLGPPPLHFLQGWQRISQANPFTSFPSYTRNFPPLPPPSNPSGWQTVTRHKTRTSPPTSQHTGPVRNDSAKLLATTVRLHQQEANWRRQLPTSINRRLSQLFQDLRPAGRPSSTFEDQRDETLDTVREMIAELVRAELRRSYQRNVDQLRTADASTRDAIEQEAVELLQGSGIPRDVIDAVIRDTRPQPLPPAQPDVSLAHGSRHRTISDSTSSSDDDSDIDLPTDCEPIIAAPLPPRTPKTPKRKRASPPSGLNSTSKPRLSSPPPATPANPPAARQLFSGPSTVTNQPANVTTKATPPTASADVPIGAHTSPATPTRLQTDPAADQPAAATTTTTTTPATTTQTTNAGPTEPVISSPPTDHSQHTAEHSLFSPLKSPRHASNTSSLSSVSTPATLPSHQSSPASAATDDSDILPPDSFFRPPSALFVLGDLNVAQWPTNNKDRRLSVFGIEDLTLSDMATLCQRALTLRPDLSAIIVAVGLADVAARPAPTLERLQRSIRQLSTLDPRILFAGVPEFEQATVVEAANIVLINKLARATFKDRYIRINNPVAVDLLNSAQPQLAYGPLTAGNVYKSVATFLNNCSFFNPLSPPLTT